jgi:hypothetical protein
MELNSIDFPGSFPPDLMHLVYENVVPALFRHFRGVFFRSKAKTHNISQNAMETMELTGAKPTGLVEASAQDSEQVHDTCSSGSESNSGHDNPPRNNQKCSRPGQLRSGKDEKQLAKFVIMDDPWNIHPDQWTRIGQAFEQSAAHFPTSFGEPLRNFYRYCHELKGAEWSVVTRQAAPIFLKTLLSVEDYDGYLLLVDAVVLLEKHCLSDADIKGIRNLIIQFSEYYERRFYKEQWDHLRVCLPTFHQLLLCAHMHEPHKG